MSRKSVRMLTMASRKGLMRPRRTPCTGNIYTNNVSNLSNQTPQLTPHTIIGAGARAVDRGCRVIESLSELVNGCPETGTVHRQSQTDEASI